MDPLHSTVMPDRNFRVSANQLHTPRYPHALETLVARGAVFRAINKSEGPSRRTTANVAILQTELYNPKQFRGHRDAPPERPYVDGRQYVEYTAQWIIKKSGCFRRFELDSNTKL